MASAHHIMISVQVVTPN